MVHLFNDKARIIEFLELLPEQFIDDFVNYYLYNGNYPQHFNIIFDRYKNKRKEILFQFSNSEIKKAFAIFNENFDVLMDFLIINFSIPKSQYREESNLNICYLQPRIHHNFRLSEGGKVCDTETDSIKWNVYKSELEKKSIEFEDSYKKLIILTKNKIENIQPGFLPKISIFIKKHFVQLVIGVLVTVIGGIILSFIL